ncbi:DUF3231 family protein [Weizmannia acidilactici]|uniref:DUF3231 family protein n=1 Tax=Weizmannia acidilactici TaxID=2607726 RepID=UPI0020A333AB|nr:DUF3231 family protein [Weizmannia acidilactici]
MEETGSLSIPNPFQRYPIYLTLHKILDGTLFSDVFYLHYVKNMVRGGLVTHANTLPQLFREDILSFGAKCLSSYIELNQETTEILLKKGLAERPPYIVYPKETEFVQKQSFILEILGKRSLTATEITTLYANIMTNLFGSCIAAGFAQTAKSKKVCDYIARGKELAQKHIKVFSDYLEHHSLPVPMLLAVNQDVTNLTEPPFSDKLMMYHFGLMIYAGIGNYGTAISECMRSDLATDYSRLQIEILKFSEDGLNIMIDNNWFEQPPLAKG